MHPLKTSFNLMRSHQDPTISRIIPGGHWVDCDDTSSSDVPARDPTLEDRNTGVPNPYDDSILSFYRREATRRRFNPKYLEEVQTLLERGDRDTGVAWMIQTGFRIGASNEAIFLSVKIFDYFISKWQIPREEVEHWCACGLLIGVKTEDTDFNPRLCKRIRDNAHDVAEQQMTELEIVMFRVIEFNSIFSTPVIFARYYTKYVEDGKLDDVTPYVWFFAFCALSVETCSALHDEDVGIACVVLAAKLVSARTDGLEITASANAALPIVLDAVRFVTHDETSIVMPLFHALKAATVAFLDSYEA